MKLTSRVIVAAVILVILCFPAMDQILKPGQETERIILPEGVSGEWWSAVQRDLRMEEYKLSRAPQETKALYQAGNGAQNFSTLFSEKGINVSPLRGGGKSWTWGLELSGAGEEKPALSVSDNRIEYFRDGIAEWYINDERGLEQGFTVRQRSSANGTTPLNIDMKLTGTLLAKFAEDGKSVDFYDNGNISVLRYGELKTTDAAGRILPSRFEAINGGIRIAVDDEGAVYPITIDPLATSPSWTAYGTGYEINLGCSVATAGDVNADGYSDVLVGASKFTTGFGPSSIPEVGVARLYLGSASGLSSIASWGYAGSAEYDHVGTSVSTAGDVNGDGYSDVIVGAPGIGNGRTMVFLGGSAGLSADYDWTLYGADEPNIGAVVAPAGDVNGDGFGDVICSTLNDDSYFKGYVYVCYGSPLGITASNGADWMVQGEAQGDMFGSSISTAGDVNGDGYADVIVGAKKAGSSAGKAYLYFGGASGLSTTAAWNRTGTTAGDLLGNSVMTAGDANGDGYSDIIVGASGYSGSTGTVYFFPGSSSGPASLPWWIGTGEAAGDQYGYSLATAGDTNGDGYSDVIISAYGYSSLTGKVYLYSGSSAGLSVSPSWTATGVTPGDHFGCSIMTAGDSNGDGFSDIVIGAENYNGSYPSGVVFAFNGSASGPASAYGWMGTGEAISNYFGWSAASAGDVNGDGYSDVVVGAYFHNSAQGKAYLYPGSATGLSSTASWNAAGESAGNYFGSSVASAGDVNGDGYSDVLIGAKNHNSNTGKAYLYIGGTTGLSSSASWTAAGEAAGIYFGGCVASAGDVNGDGFSDVIVGASGYVSSTGRAYLYLGGVAGLPASYSWTGTGEAAGDNYGYSLASAGDVNGDGYSDVIVGAYKHNLETGKAYVYHGSASGLSSTASWAQAGASVSYRFGNSVATAGDVNGDGYSDIIVGANYYNDRAGKAYLYNGSSAGLSASHSWTADGEDGGFGSSVSTAGDVNGDGFSDFLVGAPNYGASSQGKAYLYLGSASGASTAASWTALGFGSTDRLGFSVASAGDINGDGFSDIILGAPYAGTSAGAAYMHYGNGGAGLTVRLRQLRNDLSAPIAQDGNAYEQSFRIRMQLRTPFGRAWVKPEWQATPLLGTYNAAMNPVQSQARWWDPGTAGIAPTETVDISEMEGAWIWRMRVKYNPAQSPFQSHGRWLTVCANGAMETDLRSVASSAPPACVPPDEPCWIYLVTTTGTDHTLNFQDPNQSNQRTGWNIRRSNDPSLLPKSSWPLAGTNCVDMDTAAANYQWTDSSGDDPAPGAVWYYLVTAYNDNCPAEGPFATD